MPCGGCKKQRAPVVMPQAMARSMNEGATATMSADAMVWVRLNDNNLGDHPIIFTGTNYGYRAHGDRFLMMEAHAKLDHRVIIEALPTLNEPERAKPTPLGAPKVISDEDFASWDEPVEEGKPQFELDRLWGMNGIRKGTLMSAGIYTVNDLMDADREMLGRLLGLAPLTVGRLIASAERLK
jgi:hypothetical protein